MYSDKLGQIGGIKGRVTVELFNAETKEREFSAEKDNLVFSTHSNFYKYLLSATLRGSAMKHTSFPYSNLQSTDLERFFSLLYLSTDASDVEETESRYFNITDIVGWASLNTQYTGSDSLRGTLNLSESIVDSENQRLRFVIDFPSNAANGSFQSIGLGTGGTVNGSDNLMIGTYPSPVFDKDMDIQLSPVSLGTSFKLINEILYSISYTGATTDNIIATATNLFTAKRYTIKKNTGADLYAFGVVGHTDTHLYVTDISGFIYKYALPLAEGNNLAVQTAVAAPISGIESLVVSDTEAYSKTSSTSVDSVTGEPYNRYIYRFNPTTGVVLDRLRIPELVHTLLADNGTASKYAGLEFLGKDSVTGDLIAKQASSTTYTFIKLNFDNETYSILRAGYINGNMPPCYGLINNRICGFRISSQSPYVYNGKKCFFEFKDFGSKFTRVVLPAPATKVNTQTMKITYDLIFGEGVI